MRDNPIHHTFSCALSLHVCDQDASGQKAPSAEEDRSILASSSEIVVPSQGEGEEDRLLHLPLVTSYNGQFNYIVPSETATPEANIAEVLPLDPKISTS